MSLVVLLLAADAEITACTYARLPLLWFASVSAGLDISCLFSCCLDFMFVLVGILPVTGSYSFAKHLIAMTKSQ